MGCHKHSPRPLTQNTLKPRHLASWNEWLMKDAWILSLFWPVPGGLKGHVHQTTITDKKKTQTPSKDETRALFLSSLPPDAPSISLSFSLSIYISVNSAFTLSSTATKKKKECSFPRFPDLKRLTNYNVFLALPNPTDSPIDFLSKYSPIYHSIPL